MTGSAIAIALGKAAAPAAMGVLRSYGKRKYDELIAAYTNILDDFIASSLDRCGQVKTLLNGEEPIPLTDIYVETRFHNKHGAYSDQTFIQKFCSETGSYVISGFAGSGKSMFMKFAAFRLIETMLNHQRVPLFVEVRDLNYEDGSVSLDKMLFDYCSSSDNRANFEQFVVGLREGLFIIMLDGVDEAPIDKLELFQRKIAAFTKNYRQCSVVASVRPGTQLSNITSFRTYKVSSMELDQVLEVVERAPLDPSRKTLFKDSLKSGLYETHKSFLSNPLLVTIVLITFDDASRIPTHLTDFYGAAFEALFGRHDWSKGVYVREHKSKLEKPEFERAFMYFCYVSYFQSSYIFEKDRVIELLSSALKHARLSISTDAYLHDCVLAVCLLQFDEPKVIFVHRSFQEYFTAKFISQHGGPKLPTMIDWIAKRSFTDSTFLMTAQLNKEAVVRAWGLPRIKDVHTRWIDYRQSGDILKIYDEAGINGLLIDIENGSITGFGVDHTNGFATLECLLMLGSADMANYDIIIGGNIYPNGRFGDLPPGAQGVLRKLSNGGESAMIQLNRGNSSLLNHLQLRDVTDNFLSDLDNAFDEMTAYISERDEFVEIVDLVAPSEAGFLT